MFPGWDSVKLQQVLKNNLCENDSVSCGKKLADTGLAPASAKFRFS